MHGSKTVRQQHSTTLSKQLLERGRRAIAGGDSSTMRVLPYHIPLVAAFGRGSRMWDEDGNEYIDLNMAYGPLLLGHRPPQVIEAVTGRSDAWQPIGLSHGDHHPRGGEDQAALSQPWS